MPENPGIPDERRVHVVYPAPSYPMYPPMLLADFVRINLYINSPNNPDNHFSVAILRVSELASLMNIYIHFDDNPNNPGHIYV